MSRKRGSMRFGCALVLGIEWCNPKRQQRRIFFQPAKQSLGAVDLNV